MCNQRRLLLPLLLITSFLSHAQTPNFDFFNRGIVRISAQKDNPDAGESPRETGTGFVVAFNAGVIRILTAAHVVSHAHDIRVTFVSDRSHSVTATLLPAGSDALDLAVLEVRMGPGYRFPEKLPQFAWVPNVELRPSQHVWTVNGDWEPVPNNIVRLDQGGNIQKFTYTQVSIGQGFSGAPVFDDSGRIVGVHEEATNKNDFKLSVAVKIEAAIDTLDAIGYAKPTLNTLLKVQAQGNPQQAARQAPVSAQPPAESKPQPAQQSKSAAPALWRNTANNQLYILRQDAGHLIIADRSGAVVADLAYITDKRGAKRYVGNSRLSSCPNGGYMEIAAISPTRIDARVEVKPAQGNCGGVFGMLRQTTPIAFLLEPQS